MPGPGALRSIHWRLTTVGAGEATAIYNRLMALLDPGTHPYYARVDSALVSLAVHPPCGPPRSDQDLLKRFDAGWLRRAHPGRHHFYSHPQIPNEPPQPTSSPPPL